MEALDDRIGHIRALKKCCGLARELRDSVKKAARIRGKRPFSASLLASILPGTKLR
jgi:hypothetical protein